MLRPTDTGQQDDDQPNACKEEKRTCSSLTPRDIKSVNGAQSWARMIEYKFWPSEKVPNIYGRNAFGLLNVVERMSFSFRTRFCCSLSSVIRACYAPMHECIQRNKTKPRFLHILNLATQRCSTQGQRLKRRALEMLFSVYIFWVEVCTAVQY